MNYDPIADFLYEAGMLAKTPRSGFFFLGSGEQSVAEHINRVCYIGFVLASLDPDADMSKVLKMCLLHDLPEARVSDLNYVHQKYNDRHEDRALQDSLSALPFKEGMKAVFDEYEKRESAEAKIAKDADNLEWIISLKEQVDIGNKRAESWIPSAVKRLKTDGAKKLAEKILEIDSDHWWFGDKEDSWWVSRTRQQ